MKHEADIDLMRILESKYDLPYTVNLWSLLETVVESVEAGTFSMDSDVSAVKYKDGKLVSVYPWDETEND